MKGAAQPQAPSPAHPVLTMAFGLGCLAFPPLLALAVLLGSPRMLLGFGRAGAVVWLFLAGAATAVALGGLLRIVRAAHGWPKPARLRACLLSGATALLVAGALTLVQIPLTVQGRFEVSGTGEIIAVLPPASRAQLRAGHHAQLWVPSAAGGAAVAEGVLADSLKSGDQELRYRVLLSHGQAHRAPLPAASGPISVRAGDVGAPAWLWAARLRPVLSALGKA